MKRAVTVLAVCALGALPSAASAAQKDMVKGHGQLLGDSLNHFNFEAFRDPATGAVNGKANVHDNTTKDGTPKRSFFGDVTCLEIVGNKAVFIVDFRKQKNRPFDGALFTVEDNGKDNQTSPDRIGIRDFNGPPPPCPSPLAILPPAGTLLKGDIVVAPAGS